MFCLISVVALVGVKIRLVHLKALEMRMRKLVLNLSLAQILPEKINKMISPNIIGFIDVNRTVIAKNIHYSDFADSIDGLRHKDFENRMKNGCFMVRYKNVQNG